MSYSSLTSKFIPASSSNYTKGRNGYKICKITPHHMAGKLTAIQCANIFANPKRQASSNYGIGYDGEIVCYVEEENRSWCSANRVNDFQSITIEVSNSANGTDHITEASWNALVDLCVDICKRYNFRLNYDGTPNGSLTRHNMFQNTNCPGAYLQSRFPELVELVNAKLDSQPTPQPIPTPAENSYLVTVTANVLNVRAGAGTNNAINTTVKKGEVYTIVKTQGNWGKLKSGAGWICLDYTDKVNPNKNKYELGLYVVNTPSGLNVRSGAGTNNKIIKTYKNGTRFDTYEIKENWARTPSGWVCLDYCTLVKKY